MSPSFKKRREFDSKVRDRQMFLQVPLRLWDGVDCYERNIILKVYIPFKNILNFDTV